MSQTGKREWQTTPTDRDRNSCTHASVCVQPLTHRHMHTHTDKHTGGPWSILWPVGDLTAQQLLAVWCFTLRITFHFQTLHPIGERQKDSDRGRLFFLATDQTRPSTASQHVYHHITSHTHTYINHSVNVLYLNLYTVTSHIQVASHTYLSLPSHI